MPLNPVPNYPASLDSLPDPTNAIYEDDDGFEIDLLLQKHNAILEALEFKLGTGADLVAANELLVGSGAGATHFRKLLNADVDAAAAIAYSKLNLASSIVAGDLNWATIPAARAYHSADQSVANATLTALVLNSERFDTELIHDTVTNNSRLTCKTAGKYIITASAGFAANATGLRLIGIRLNGTTYIAQSVTNNVGAGQNTNMECSAVYDLALNDYVELIGYQTSGGALNVAALGNYSPELAMARIG